MKEILSEVIVSMQNNRRRIALTGFSIGWGIFLLIILLGSGNGLINGTKANFGSQTDNILTIIGGNTILKHDGLPKGRKILFDDIDIEMIQTEARETVKRIYPSVSSAVVVRRGKKDFSTTLNGFEPDYMRRESVHLISGRDLCKLDIVRHEKVCVISRRMQELMFPDDRTPFGKWLNVGETVLKVIGIYELDNSMVSTNAVYAPITTVSTIYSPEKKYSSLRILLEGIKTLEENNNVKNRITDLLSKRHHCAPNDRGAIAVNTQFDTVLRTFTMMDSIKLFIWIIGLATLLAGIVGVGNIMLITVKERTKELGIRKAMGASRLNIISLVLLESIFITMLFGYIGMMLGIGLTQLMNAILENMNVNAGFVNPTVDLPTILAASMVMLVAGIIAGYIPARRAVNVKLVSALSS